jgi:hypothetical protein
VTEYAVLAFAARIGRRLQKVQDTGKLERKLEVFRKRAKRKTITRIGLSAYKREARNWLSASRWIRFNVLPMRSPSHRLGKLGIYREQYESMLRLAGEVLVERCTGMPPQEVVSKIVKLAIEEIRRHRHSGIKVRELIADSTKGKEFLFGFIAKRMEKREFDLHLKFAFQPKCVQISVRAEKFKAAMLVQDSTRQIKTAAPAPAVATELTMSVELPARLEIPNEPTDAPEEINFWVEWLLNWTLAIENDRDRLRCIFTEGLRLATDSCKPLDNRRSRIDGVEYIREIINGTLPA